MEFHVYSNTNEERTNARSPFKGLLDSQMKDCWPELSVQSIVGFFPGVDTKCIALLPRVLVMVFLPIYSVL